MAIVTSQQLKNYYEKFGDIEVTFTKEINDSLRLARNQISLKFKSGQRTCIIYSSSMNSAKVVVALTPELVKGLQEDGLVVLRFCFLKEDSEDILSFFVQCRISGLTLYDKERNLHFAQLTFTKRPPDDLIEILGNMLEANINAKRRSEERILITPDSQRQLGLASKNAVIAIGPIPRNGILRDVSFGGLRIIVMGNAKFLMNKTATVKIDLVSGKSVTVQGEIIRFEPVEGRKDLVTLAVKFDAAETSYSYKMIINDYLIHAGRSAAVRENNL